MKQKAGLVTSLVLSLVFSLINLNASGQTILNRSISIDVVRQPLDDVLEILSNKGNFYFSYNSSIIKKDSLITLSADNKTIKQVLDMLFKSGFEYKESGNYIILRRAPLKLTLITNRAVSEDKIYTVSGYVLDDQTGEKVSYASIYEKQRLASAMTNEQGYFKLKLKSKYKTASLTVSKEYYEDTTVIIEPKYNQQITITIMPMDITEQTVVISPKNYEAPDSIMLNLQQNDSVRWLYTYKKTDSVKVERTRFGQWLISSKQKFQSINLNKFFTARPYQVSFVPGLSTNGKLNSQVINNFSFNVLGGYSGGVNGMEIGGLFNINKKTVQYLQIAGILNTTGGGMNGLQIAGINNTVVDSVDGLQIAGINNHVGGSHTGMQIGGIYNHVGGSMTGIQLAGIGNFTRRKTKGIQIAGIGNFSKTEVTGVQLAGVLNYTKRLKGLQIGLINISDVSDGYSIGLINIVLKGYHKLAVFSNETMNLNVAFKTGTRNLYSILLAGMNAGASDEKIYSYGYGLGREMPFGRVIGINTEITSQYLHLGSWDHLNLLSKLNLHFYINLAKGVSIFGGPSLNGFYSNQTAAVSGYKFDIPYSSQHTFKMFDKVNGWIGWNAGISFF